MNGFVWQAGHIGWGLFALLVFSGLWLLGADLVWRLKNTRATRFAAAAVAAWIIGAALIALGYWLAHR